MFFYATAPEHINPHAFGLVHVRATRTADMFASGVFAWEVRWIFLSLSISRYSFTSRSSPGSYHLPKRFRLHLSSLSRGLAHSEVSDRVWNMI